jgi:hypothetical protein
VEDKDQEELNKAELLKEENRKKSVDK